MRTFATSLDTCVSWCAAPRPTVPTTMVPAPSPGSAPPVVSTLPQHSGPAASAGEERTDIRRYLVAIRRSRWLILGLVVVITGAVVLASLALPKTYQGHTSIVLNVQQGIGDPDPTTLERELATLQTLITSPDILARAARRLPGEDRSSLAGKLSRR